MNVISLPVIPITRSTAVIRSIYGISYLKVVFCMATFVISAVTPSIIRIFSILLPTILPTVIPALPFIPAVMLTAASGSDVPIATIVSPITSCGIPNFPASAAAPSTNTSAPFTSATKPAISSKIATKIIIFLLLLSFLRMPD